ncbi:methylated-DNA--[protein]-cysteine S-methyltransferase [Desulfohalovibrio reitneri]|uniref:methylated-DNA--[protein]-cysteine S-methyltransferase n=1 Tax=Desulfohalovibrio reitneri TaxID=1307759 RepID=UPI0004A6C618|nr:MGMT family protein [Desulfohalovibrio reitneri]
MYEYLVAPPLALTLVWEDGRLASISLEWSGGRPRRAPSTEAGGRLLDALRDYVDGRACRWPDLPLAWERLTPFQEKILRALAATEAGRTLTYGELAARCGSPGAARAVGRVMATNPWPLVVPCHRVVGSSGLTGFGPGLAMKQWLLGLERDLASR